ncbi:DMT family transporter [Bengtsoniella intestinalis]|uniref:DMT family transporter n=1 Tax=Bengtsoniella intestinalis TaxID=3073143 RepID=UPI00391F7C1D
MTKPHRATLVALHLSVLFFGLSGIFIASVEASAFAVVLGRVGFSCVALGITLKLMGKSMVPETSHLPLILLGGLLLACHWIFFVLSVQIGSVAIATITFATAPLFLSVLEPLLFGESPRKYSLPLALLVLCGVVITVPEYTLSNQAAVGTLWGMGGALTYALLALVNRKIAPHYHGVQLSFWHHAIVVAVALPLVWQEGTFLQGMDWVYVAGLGLICTALGYSLFVRAQQGVSAQTLGLVSSLETPYSIVFALVLLGQIPTVRQLIGGTIILIVALVASRLATDLPEK